MTNTWLALKFDRLQFFSFRRVFVWQVNAVAAIVARAEQSSFRTEYWPWHNAASTTNARGGQCVKSIEISTIVADEPLQTEQQRSNAQRLELRKHNSKTVMRGREYGLILGQIFLEYFADSRSLHYGLWSDDLELNIRNIGNAQDAYTDLLLATIPSNARSVLDVGCGVGSVAKRLVDLHYDVECLSPSFMLNEEARRNVPGIIVHDSGFEDFVPARKFDVVLFAESFQYVESYAALSKAAEMLTASGVIIVCDKFKCEENGKSPIGGGHQYRDYLRTCRDLELECIQDIDLTERIAPNFDLLQDFRQRVIEPAAEKIEEITSYKLRFSKYLFFTALKMILLRMIAKHRNKERDGNGFKRHNTYRLNVLRPCVSIK